jgi:hypothetical protein
VWLITSATVVTSIPGLKTLVPPSPSKGSSHVTDVHGFLNARRLPLLLLGCLRVRTVLRSQGVYRISYMSQSGIWRDISRYSHEPQVSENIAHK